MLKIQQRQPRCFFLIVKPLYTPHIPRRLDRLKTPLKGSHAILLGGGAQKRKKGVNLRPLCVLHISVLENLIFVGSYFVNLHRL